MELSYREEGGELFSKDRCRILKVARALDPRRRKKNLIAGAKHRLTLSRELGLLTWCGSWTGTGLSRPLLFFPFHPFSAAGSLN